jgi:hypothetical protein
MACNVGFIHSPRCAPIANSGYDQSSARKGPPGWTYLTSRQETRATQEKAERFCHLLAKTTSARIIGSKRAAASSDFSARNPHPVTLQ